MYNFLYEKINLDRILWHYGSMHFGCFIQNPVQDTWASALSELFRIESTVYFSENLLWTRSSASLCCNHSVSREHCLFFTKFACYDHELISELSSTIFCTWKSNWIEFCDKCYSMQFGCFIQNPVQDTWASVLSELFRIESTVFLLFTKFALD